MVNKTKTIRNKNKTIRNKNKTLKNKKHYNKPKIFNINGVSIFYVKTSLDILRVDGYVRTGYYTENINNLGINHLLEHLMVDSYDKCKDSCIHYFNSLGHIINGHTHEFFVKYVNNNILESKSNKESLEYIIHSLLKPKKHIWKKILTREKKAVIQELKTLLNTSNFKFVNEQNKILYNNQGLQYIDNMYLQLTNLKNINIDMLYKYYNEYYSRNNICISIIGNIKYESLVKLLKSVISKPTTSDSYDNMKTFFSQDNYSSCIISPQLKNRCVYYISNNKSGLTEGDIKNKNKNKNGISKNVRMEFVFFNKIIYHKRIQVYINVILLYIKRILFYELRTKSKYVYSIYTNPVYTSNNIQIKIETFCEPVNAKKVYNKIVILINDIIKHGFDVKLLQSIISILRMSYYRTQYKNNTELNSFYENEIIHHMDIDKNNDIMTPYDIRNCIDHCKIESKGEIHSYLCKLFNTQVMFYQYDYPIFD